MKVYEAVGKPSPASVAEAGIADLVSRIRPRIDELRNTMASRYRSEIADYSTLDEEVLYEDVVAISIQNVRVLLDTLESGREVGSEQLEEFRESGARRVRQGVGVESVLHAYRLWGQIVWQAVLDAAAVDRPAEREAALIVAGRIIEHLNVVSTVVTQGYLDEAEGFWSDREVVRRDVLSAVISGRGESAAVREAAVGLGLHLSNSYIVILARKAEPSPDVRNRPLASRAAMRGGMESMKQFLRPTGSSLLVGSRHDEVVALYPIDHPEDLEVALGQAVDLAAAAGSDGFEVGVGGWHPGPSGVGTSYGEAQEALTIAGKTRVRGRPVVFEDVLLDHVLRSNPKSKRMLTDTLTPIVEYDDRHNAQLVATLRAYMDAGFNITKSASALCVHPNTVVYRLKRIKELTARDPHLSSDLLLLCLGLKLIESVDAEAPRVSG